MIVIDCSVVVDALSGFGGDDLRASFEAEELHAPSLLDYEVVSAVRGLVLVDRLSVPRARDLLADFDDLPIHRWPPADALRRRAFALPDNVSAYDGAYVALAEALECPLLTRDARLGRTTGHDAEVLVR